MTKSALTTVEPFRADPAKHPEMIDVAIALLGVARGRHRDQQLTLVEATRVLLDSIAQPAPLVDVAAERGAPRRVKPVKATKVRASKPKPAAHTDAPSAPDEDVAGGGQTIANGVTVSLAPGAESIEHDGKVIEVTDRQAKLFAILAAGSPSPIDRKFIAKKLWAPARAPDSADTIVTSIATSCDAAAASVGLIIKTVRGVGIALQRLADQ